MACACFAQNPFEPSLLLVGDEAGGVHVLRFLNPRKCLFKNTAKKERSFQRIYFHVTAFFVTLQAAYFRCVDVTKRTLIHPRQHLRDHEAEVSYRHIPGVHRGPVNRIMFESEAEVIMTSSQSPLTSVVFFNMSQKQSPYTWKVNAVRSILLRGQTQMISDVGCSNFFFFKHVN